LRELAIVAAGRALQILIGLVALRVITWQLDHAELGKYSLILTITTLFALALINPLGMYFYRHLHEWVEQGRGPIFMLLALLGCAVMAALSALLIVLAYALGFEMDLGWMLLLIAGSLLLVSANNTLVPAFNILGYRLHWVVLSVVTLGLSLGFSYSLMNIQPAAEYWILGQLLGHGLMLIPVIVVFYRLVRSHLEPVLPGLGLARFFDEHGGNFIRFSWPLSIAVTLNWGQFQSFKVFLGEMGSLETLGYFTAAYAVCAGVMASIESVAQQYFYPKFYRDISQASQEQCIASWRQYAGVMMPVVTLFFMFVLCFAEPLLVLLVDAKYHDAVLFVYVAAFVEYFRVMGNIYSLCMQATKETTRLIRPQLLGSSVALTSVPMLIWLAGTTGFAVAVVFSSALYVWLIRSSVTEHAGRQPEWLGGRALWMIALIFVLASALLAQLELNLFTSFASLAFGGIITLGGLYSLIRTLKGVNSHVG